MSAKTITRHWPTKTPEGDRPAMCDYCGVMWRRSKLRRDEAGLLTCPDEGEGGDVVSLERQNAEGALESTAYKGPDEGGTPMSPVDASGVVDIATTIGGVTFG